MDSAQSPGMPSPRRHFLSDGARHQGDVHFEPPFPIGISPEMLRSNLPFDPFKSSLTLHQPAHVPTTSPLPPPHNPVGAQHMRPSPRKRKPKAPPLRDEDWEPVKAHIIEHSKTLVLRDIMAKMEKDFGFVATEIQYKQRLKKWRLGKNVRRGEMKAIVRKRQQRAIQEPLKKALQFELRNDIVPSEKIERWMGRNGVARDSLYSPPSGAPTPEGLTCWTPQDVSTANTPISAPDSPGVANGESASAPGHTAASLALSFSTIELSTPIGFQGQSPRPTYQSLGDSHQSISCGTLHAGSDAEEVRLRREIAALEKQDGKGSPNIVTKLNALTRLLLAAGRYKSAEEVAQRLVSACRSLYGDNHSSTGSSLRKLGEVLYDQGHRLETENLSRRAYKVHCNIPGPEHSETLASIAILTLAYTSQGRYVEAENLLRPVVEASKRIFDADHPFILASEMVLMEIYQCQGRYSEAEELGERLLETGKRVFGAEHLNTLRIMKGRARTLQFQGRCREAIELGEQLLETAKTVLGPEHPDTLSVAVGLSEAYRCQGRYSEAERLGRRVLETYRRVLGAGHPKTIEALSTMAVTLGAHGRYREAEESAMQAYKISVTTLGMKHPMTLFASSVLALAYGCQRRWIEAGNLVEGAFDSMERVLGAEHPRTLTIGSIHRGV